MTKKKKGFKLPDTYVLLFLLALVFAILTYVIPAGEYVRVEDAATGRMVVDPESFHYIDRTPITFFGFFEAIFTSFTSMSEMIFFTLIVAGAFSIIRATGAIDGAIGKMIHVMNGKEKLAIPVLVILFSLFGSIMGCAEELLPFYPIVISLAVALGFDSITGVAIILCGAGAGFAGAMLNPFTIGVAHGIAGLPAFSGLGFRVVVNVVLVLITIIYIYRYAAKIHGDPSKSEVHETDLANFKQETAAAAEFTTSHKLVLAIFVVGLVWMAYGVVKQGWGFTQLAALYLIVSIIAGIIGKLGANGIVKAFVEGMSGMVYGAFLIGAAASVSTVMSQGQILDTIIHALASLISGFIPAVSGVLMFLVQTLINFFVPSGSGQATVSMPIMAPLAELVGLTRQTAVLAFQFGDGFSNMIFPTVGYMMAGLALGKLEWTTWAKWAWKLVVIWSLVGAVFVAIAATIGYGPF